MSPDLRILVDEEDAHLLTEYEWTPRKTSQRARTYYADTWIDGRKVRLHRMLMDFPPENVDHINGNGLDNRRANLRLSSPTLNAANARPQRGTSSRFKGVCWDKSRSRWHVSIRSNWKQRNLGRYDDEVEAARVYDKAALDLWGEHAWVNGV